LTRSTTLEPPNGAWYQSNGWRGHGKRGKALRLGLSSRLARLLATGKTPCGWIASCAPCGTSRETDHVGQGGSRCHCVDRSLLYADLEGTSRAPPMIPWKRRGWAIHPGRCRDRRLAGRVLFPLYWLFSSGRCIPAPGGIDAARYLSPRRGMRKCCMWARFNFILETPVTRQGAATPVSWAAPTSVPSARLASYRV
jgi:hypothetical protein